MVHNLAHDCRMFDEVLSETLLYEVTELTKTVFKVTVFGFLHRFGELVNRLLDIRLMRCLFTLLA